jgi:hypothetical protein
MGVHKIGLDFLLQYWILLQQVQCVVQWILHKATSTYFVICLKPIDWTFSINMCHLHWSMWTWTIQNHYKKSWSFLLEKSINKTWHLIFLAPYLTWPKCHFGQVDWQVHFDECLFITILNVVDMSNDDFHKDIYIPH